jgi:dienelactone hydrolase
VGGDPDTEAGKAFLESRSPVKFADLIMRPLLIGHGANDPRVKVAESEQIVESMKKKGIPVTYCYFRDEGHGFRKWQNSNSFYALVEIFLAKHLGGRFEPMTADDFKGSSLEVKAGMEFFEGLDKLLPQPAPKPGEK